MELLKLLEKVNCNIIGDSAKEITGVSRDNREAKAGDLFICIKGLNFDSHNPAVVRALVEKGVKVFVCERDVTEGDDSLATLIKEEDVCLVLVENTRAASGFIYAAWYDYPAKDLIVMGVTGSKGKTTTTNLVANILQADGKDVGIIGSNMFRLNDEIVEWTSNTTPDSDLLYKYMRYLVDHGCKYLVMEVSSQATIFHRVDSVNFDYGLWLNIQHGDHINPGLEHETFDEYIDCKAAIIDSCKHVFINMDDEYTDEFISRIHVPFEKIGKGEDCDYRITNIRKEYNEEKQYPGIGFTVSGKRNIDAWVMLPGDFNAYNALAAIVLTDKVGVSDEAIRKGLSDVNIKGRTEIIYRSPRISLSTDDAHNQASAAAQLIALREFNPKRLVCIFGADGRRDKSRRPGLGEVVARFSDFAIVSSTNTRDENFDDIVESIMVGINKVEGAKYVVIEDRAEAIRYALENSEEGDWIAMLGQGHLDWLLIGNEYVKHSDGECALGILKEMGIYEEKYKA